MSKKKLAEHTNLAIKAMERDEPIPSVVFLPPALRENKKQVVYAFNGEGPDVQGNIVRIQNEADPLGLAIAIATGQPVLTHTVKKDGTVETKYETLPLTSPLRERMIRWLGDKVQPRLSVRKTISKKGDAGTDHTSEWEAITGGAAEREDEAD